MHNEDCARCSATSYKDDTCTEEFKYVNCGEKHASSKKCRYHKRDYDIQHIGVSKHVCIRKCTFDAPLNYYLLKLITYLYVFDLII